MFSRLPLILALLGAALSLAAGQSPAPGDKTDRPVMPAVEPSTYDYVIGAHDLLNITVFELEQLNRTRRVDSDGTITLPLLGQVALGGLTPKQAEETIADLLRQRKLVLEPQVSVFVEEYRSRLVTIQGAVAKPGAYTMLGQKTLLDMIGEAGGLNDRAGKQIFVLRPFTSGGEDRIEIDTEALVFEGDPLMNIMLQPGDIIMVPYERMIRIYVNGAVRNPGPQEFPSDEEVSLLMAVTAAGGTTDRANESNLAVKRKLEGGGEQIFKVNLRRIMRGKDDDILLQKNDVVIVRESFF